MHVRVEYHNQLHTCVYLTASCDTNIVNDKGVFNRAWVLDIYIVFDVTCLECFYSEIKCFSKSQGVCLRSIWTPGK